MTASIKKQYSSTEKLRVAAEALSGHMTQNEITKRYKVHTTQISNWKKRLKQAAEVVFGSKCHDRQQEDKERLIEDLYREIGKLKYELEWLKKKSEIFD